ncbi:hypothetical protein V6N13_135157 [Hibiscus sabdariffa]
MAASGQRAAHKWHNRWARLHGGHIMDDCDRHPLLDNSTFDLWAIKAKNGDVFPHHDPQPKAPATSEKPPKVYPTDDVKKSLLNKHKPKSTKLRFMGKRVVFLKQLTFGLLLVIGIVLIS